VRPLQRVTAATRSGIAGTPLRLSRREILAGGVGAGALIALPDLSLAGRFGGRAVTSGAPASSAKSASRYVLIYGVPDSSAPGASIEAAMSPAAKAKTLPQPKAVAAQLAALPVASPNQESVALVTVENVSRGASVTLTLVNAASAVVEKKGTLAITGIADGSSIIATTVFAPGTTTIALVLGITEPTDKRPAVKKDPRTGQKVPFDAVTWVSHHELAYFDTATGTFSGPFSLNDAPALALHSAGANSSDLFVWTTAEPQPGTKKGTQAPLPWVSAFPLGTGKARLRVPSPAPWPGGEPVATLAGGDVARFVNGSAVQVASAQTGEVTQTKISALSGPLAKPGAVTMTARPDGSVFIAKPAAGRAVLTDPQDSFSVKAQVDFPAPAYPGGGPASKAVLSASGDTLYVLGGAKAGGLSAYSVATGKMTASYSHSAHYNALYLLPSGDLLAMSAANPRLAFFSPDLEQIGTASTTLQIAAAY
jgi:hypothetical protein